MRSRSVFSTGQEKKSIARHQPTVKDGRRRSEYMPTSATTDSLKGETTTVKWGARTVLDSGDCGMVVERIDAACATRWLSHPSATRAVFVVDGSVFMRRHQPHGDSGKGQEEIRRGDMRLIQPKEAYQFATATFPVVLLTVQVPDYFDGIQEVGESMRGAVAVEPDRPPRTNGSMVAAQILQQQRENTLRARRTGKPITG